jgi:hypothetical protein
MEPAVRLTELRRHIDRVPFRPFRLHLSDGTAHDVLDANLIFLLSDSVILGILAPGDEIPSRAKYYDPLHITQVELMGSEPPRA